MVVARRWKKGVLARTPKALGSGGGGRKGLRPKGKLDGNGRVPGTKNSRQRRNKTFPLPMKNHAEIVADLAHNMDISIGHANMFLTGYWNRVFRALAKNGKVVIPKKLALKLTSGKARETRVGLHPRLQTLTEFKYRDVSWTSKASLKKTGLSTVRREKKFRLGDVSDAD